MTAWKEKTMAYYNVNGKHIDIYCGNADAHDRGCSGECEKCRFCEVENLDTGEKIPYVGSEYDK